MQSTRAPSEGEIYNAYPVPQADVGVQTLPVLLGKDVENGGAFVAPKPPKSRKCAMVAGIGLGVLLFVAVIVTFTAVKLAEWHKHQAKGSE